MHDLLQQGISAAKAGRREEARTLLMQVIEADERNEQAWLWLAGVVDAPTDMRICLENVLELNPGNTRAQEGLKWILERYADQLAVADPVAAEVTPEAVAAATAAPVDATAAAAVTGATIRLTGQPGQAAVAPSPEPAPAPVLPSPAPVPASPSPAPATIVDGPPCFYCGAATSQKQEHCPQCRNSLMIRVDPPAVRSVWLVIMTILSGIGSALWMLSGVLLFIAGFLIASGGQMLRQNPGELESAMQELPPGSEMPSGFDPIQLIDLLGSIVYAVAFAFLIGGIFYIFVTRGLWKRQKWAYIVAIVVSALGVLGSFISLILSLVTREALAQNLFSAVIQGLLTALVVLSYHDFFGPKVRFVPQPESGRDTDHYNWGVAYKKRGMWYLAAKEWEVAVKKAPRDLTYLHALGLAYLQLKQFDKARETLDRALAFAPSDANLQESRALIERMAAGK